MTPTIINANCLDALRDMPDNSVDAVITDPPYGLSNTTPDKVADTIVRWASGDREHVPTGRGFMGAAWDSFVPPPAVWDECYRVLKPGGHLAVFAGSRTQDLMGISVRLAGFEVRDSVAWLYGSGFPKSHDVSKALDKAAGAEREVVGSKLGRPGYHLTPGVRGGEAFSQGLNGHTADERLSASQITAPATDEARRWQGWGTALKPGHEPILLARKPLEGTVAANVTTWGTGAINIDATRIGYTAEALAEKQEWASKYGGQDYAHNEVYGKYANKAVSAPNTAGRFPANVVLDEHAAHELDQQSGEASYNPAGQHGIRKRAGNEAEAVGYASRHVGDKVFGYGDRGGASRFFKVMEPDPPFMYAAKAPKRERPNVDGVQHPTVKPLALMRWLVRLLTPPGGVVLDPFAGSGTTVEAAMLEGFHPIGIEAHEPYIRLIEERVARNTPQGGLLDGLEESA